MALINCPECGTQVSSMAESCPKCAFPIAGGGSSQAHGGKIQTIEKTSKPYKLQQILAAALVFGSFFALIISIMEGDTQVGLGLSAFGVLLGTIWYIVVQFMIWWHHG